MYLLVNLSHRRWIDRVVLNEAHIPVMCSKTNFRLNLLKIQRLLNSSSFPLLFLSATIPPSMMTSFTAYYQISGAQVIRKCTNRANIRYAVIEQSSAYLALGCLKQLLDKFKSENGRRAIIYCRSKSLVDQVSELFGTLKYHADMPMDEREINYTKFSSDMLVDNIIAATGALGAGVDPDWVDLVIHLGGIWSLVDFHQESGRAGRQGQSASSVIITTRPVQNLPQNTFEEQSLYSFYTSGLCRRYELSAYIDGEGYDCLTGPNNQCDICCGFGDRGSRSLNISMVC